MKEWKSGDFTRKIEEKYGNEGLDIKTKTISSIQGRLFQANFHAKESERYSQKAAESPKDIMSSILNLAAGSEEVIPFLELAWKSDAHLVACIAILHSLPDIMAHVICFATGMSVEDVSNTEINIYKVKNYVTVREMSRVCVAIDRLCDSQSFKYVSAYNNTVKHRMLIGSGPSIDFRPLPGQHGLRIEKFTYKSKIYPETWFSTVIGPYRNEIEESVLDIGFELNDFFVV